ncbi:MAG: cation:proton antiporter [Betaproteobacteria bacterium]|nr:cation:proton antiporter [Betaproteobacteria bacterium]
MNTAELFLLAMTVIFSVPWLIWRFARTDYFAPLVVIQILTGILLGPGLLGRAFPESYQFIFTPSVAQALSGIASWAVTLFVFIAGIELDLRQAWAHRREGAITAGLALLTPLALGSAAAVLLLATPGWIGPEGQSWQFILGVGMACSVTALPILMLLLEKLDILRHPIGQRTLRYASLDDIVVWALLALILMDWERMGRQVLFLAAFACIAWAFRRLMAWLSEQDRWYVALVWLTSVSLAADWAGMHFMVGAFMAGAVIESDWFDQHKLDQMRHTVLLVLMPVFFLSTGLRTNWELGGYAVLMAASLLLIASVAGKLLGIHLAGRILGWKEGEAGIIGWLLQTKALIMIIFSSILLDRGVITAETFTALLLMAVMSTMLTVPMVAPRLARFSTHSRRGD